MLHLEGTTSLLDTSVWPYGTFPDRLNKEIILWRKEGSKIYLSGSIFFYFPLVNVQKASN
jgi:hypothetical protein